MVAWMLAAALGPGAVAVQVVEKPRESSVVEVRWLVFGPEGVAERFRELVLAGTDARQAARAAIAGRPGGLLRWWELSRGRPLRALGGRGRPEGMRARSAWRCRPAQVRLPSGGRASGALCRRVEDGVMETEERALGLVLRRERVFDAGGEVRVDRRLRTLELHVPATGRP